MKKERKNEYVATGPSCQRRSVRRLPSVPWSYLEN